MQAPLAPLPATTFLVRAKKLSQFGCSNEICQQGYTAPVQPLRSISVENSGAAPPPYSPSTLPYSARRSADKALSKQVAACNDVAELAALYYNQQHQLTPLHISAALTTCAKRFVQPRLRETARRSEQHTRQVSSFVQDALQLLLPQVQLCTAREVATVLWCLAKLQHTPPPVILNKLTCHFLDVAHTSSFYSLANVLYALARLKQQLSPAVLDCLLHAAVQAKLEASLQAAAAYSVEGSAYAVSGSPAAAAEQQHRASCDLSLAQQPQQQQQLQGGYWFHPPRLQHLKQQPTACQQRSRDEWALAASAWAVARFEQPVVAQTWLLPLLHLLQSCRQQLSCNDSQQHLTHAGLHAACTACVMALWAAAVAASGCSRGTTWQPMQLSRLQQPVEQRQQRFRQAVAHQAGVLLQQYEFCLTALQPRGVCMLLWACNRLRLAPSRSWCQAFYTAALRISTSLSASQCTALMSGAVYLPVQPPAALCARCLAVLQPQLHSLPASQLSQLLRACARLRVRPPVAFVTQLMEMFALRHSEHTPAVVSTLLHATSRVGFRPAQAVVGALLEGVEQQLVQYRPHDLAKLLSGCAALRLQLPGPLQSALLQAFQVQLNDASPSDVTLVLRALACWRSQQQQQQQQLRQQLIPQAGPPGAFIAINRMRSLHHVANISWCPGRPYQQQANDQQHGPTGLSGLPPNAAAPLLGKAEWKSINALFCRAGSLLQYLRAVEVCQCLWAAAWLRPVLGRPWVHAVHDVLLGRMHELALGDVCLLLWSLARLGDNVRLNQQLLWLLMQHSNQLLLLRPCTPRDLSALVWGYSCMAKGWLRQLPAGWVAAFGAAVGCQLSSFTDRELDVLLRACVRLQLPLSWVVLDALMVQVETRSAKLSRSHLHSMTAAIHFLHKCRAAACTFASWTHVCAGSAVHSQTCTQLASLYGHAMHSGRAAGVQACGYHDVEGPAAAVNATPPAVAAPLLVPA